MTYPDVDSGVASGVDTDAAPESTEPGAGIAERFAFAQRVAREAGALARGFAADRASLEVRLKGPQDHVSRADEETEALIRAAVAQAYPQDAFVGEESGGQEVDTATGVWVVDPIDGTQPFLLGLPTWCVSIAYVRGGRTLLGVVLNPATDELYAAVAGGGATRNGEPIHVADATGLESGLTTIGCSSRTRPADLGHLMERLLAGGGMFHRTGSGALSLCLVATGQLIGYVEMHINAWDCLAALLIVAEAGGVATPFLAEHGVTGGGRLVAGAPGVFDALSALLPPG